VDFSLLIVFIYPFGRNFHVALLIIATIPHLFCYARDLMYIGYTIKDSIRVFAFNLLLIPINIGGLFKSIEQLLLRKKTPFQRTPKIKERTVAPAFYVLTEVFIWLSLMFAYGMDLYHGFYASAVFSAINSLLLGYALVYFVGFNTLLHDGLYALLYPTSLIR
jgi:hypothetical protein